jgi:hypothetical protein
MWFKEIGAGTLVRFDLASVVCPDQENIVEKITSRLGLTGKVVMLSDAGEKVNHYAVVRVSGIMSPVVVPVDSLEFCDTFPGSKAKKRI